MTGGVLGLASMIIFKGHGRHNENYQQIDPDVAAIEYRRHPQLGHQHAARLARRRGL